jgi:dipeptidyl aminopeptidase/acylaminoacyl peptidase
VLLNIHGGPYTQYGHFFFDEFQVQAGAGYGVVYCNPRGSSGYGTPWGRAILGPKYARDPGTGWGGVDTTDVLSALDAALARYPYLDPERVGVLGDSYGGYLTSWLVTQTDRFAAACSERAVNNVATMTHTSDIGWWFNAQYAGVTAMEDTEELLRMSPVTYADRVTTPLLILHSENDWRCPIEQAEDLYTRLRQLGRDVEFVRFPGEGHELSRSGAPKHRLQRLEIILEFFGRHLKAEPVS